MPPTKNPFDDNPHEVTWTKFSWKVDDHATPWLADSVLKQQLTITLHPDDDGWERNGILLEKDDSGRWWLGRNPYTIRW